MAELYERESPPSRAAWIEMPISGTSRVEPESPPSRAAWIEMMGDDSDDMIKRVAAFTGGVD